MGFWFKLRSGTTLAPVGQEDGAGRVGSGSGAGGEPAKEINLSQTQTSLGEWDAKPFSQP